MLKVLSLSCLLLFAWVVIAMGAVPDPSKCTVPAHAPACLVGDIAYTVTVRDAGNNPIQGAVVVADLTSALMSSGPNLSPATICLYLCSGQTLTPSAVTNASGQATFYLKTGKCCSGTYPVWVGSVNLGNITVLNSIDVNGDGALSGADVTAFAGYYFTNSPCADVNGDGAISGADATQFANHYFGNHLCP